MFPNVVSFILAAEIHCIQSAYKINNNPLKCKSSERDLGVLFSTNLKFKEHVDSVYSKANRQLCIIALVFKQKNLETVVPLYKSLVRPHLEYNSLIWSPWMKNYVSKLEEIQKICNMTKGNRSLSYKGKLKKCKLHSLQARRIKHQLVIIKMKNSY